jgi:hypothetical protein
MRPDPDGFVLGKAAHEIGPELHLYMPVASQGPPPQAGH